MMLSHNCGLSSEAKKEAKEVDPLHAGNTSSDFHNHLLLALEVKNTTSQNG